jgi:hypothetical protein
MPRPALTLPPALAPLAAQPRWLGWRWEKRDGKLSKVPYQGQASSRHASSTKPQTWCDLQTCLAADAADLFDGIGFALMDSEIAALDIDDCRNKETGELHPWAANVVARSNTYCEVTPSGQGIRLIGRSVGAHVHRKFAVADGVSCEPYRRAKRFITITCQQIGEAVELADIDALIDEVLAELENAKRRSRKKAATNGPNNTTANATNKRAANGSAKHDLTSLIKDGCGDDFGGDRSRATWYVIHQLLKLGDDPEAIVATILNPNYGISAHCLDQANPEAYARRQVENAQREREKDSGDDTELERLAELPLVDYERQRKAAAEKLSVRAPILDRLVAAKRAELGLDGDDGIQGRAVEYDEPEPWPVEVDGAKLLDDLAASACRFTVLPADAPEVSALWVTHTYLLAATDITPRLQISSPTKGCGKTTFLDWLSEVVYRPDLAKQLATVTPATPLCFRAARRAPGFPTWRS